jgi:ubiquinone/menaquinone biosynthesis C-methylase UbiE
MLKSSVHRALAVVGLRLSRVPREADAPREYIEPSLIEAAEKAGIYVGDYAEKQWDEVGRSRNIVETLYAPRLKKDSVVLEVGPGTGMFARKVLEHIPNGTMHLFEIDPYWKGFLGRMLGSDSRVHMYETNGYSYDDIRDESIDLYHANGVFVYTPHLITCRNLVEAVRVTRRGGAIAFDFFDMEEIPQIFEFVQLNAFPRPQEHWKLNSLSFLKSFMERMNCTLETTHQVKYANFHSLYCVFRKCGS